MAIPVATATVRLPCLVFFTTTEYAPVSLRAGRIKVSCTVRRESDVSWSCAGSPPVDGGVERSRVWKTAEIWIEARCRYMYRARPTTQSGTAARTNPHRTTDLPCGSE